MNIRLKILAIFILTLIIGVGGGYLYYSLITQRIVIGDPESLMYEYHPEPVVIPGVNLSNVNVKKVRRNTKEYDEMVVPDAGRKLPSEGTVGGIGSSSSGGLSGFGGYSYRRGTIESTNGGGGGAGGGGMMAYGSGGRSGGDNASGGYSSGGGMMGGTAPVLASRVPTTTTPPTMDGGTTILVDPMVDPNESDRVPVGEGMWILMLMALVYGVIKSPPAIRRRVKSEELKHIHGD